MPPSGRSATFGKPFGLELYRKDKKAIVAKSGDATSQAAASPPISPVWVHTPTIRHRSRGHRIITGGDTRTR